jgi:hypothetical protein
LLTIANDETSQKSMTLFNKFKEHLQATVTGGDDSSEHWHHESVYLLNFATQMRYNEMHS